MMHNSYLFLFRALSFLLLLLASAGAAHAQSWVWWRAAGGPQAETLGGLNLDSASNSYIAGTFSRSITFDQFTVFSNGQNTGCYIAKYNSFGRLQWAVQGNGAGQFTNAVIATDRAGNSFVAGTFQGNVNFNGTVLASQGKQDIFIARYDFYGIQQWAKRIGGDEDDVALAVAADSSGNFVIAGAFGGSATIGGATMTSAGKSDIFIARYNGSGDPLWGTRAGGTGDDRARSLAVDKNGEVLMGASFEETAVIGGTTLNSAGGTDIMFARVESDGVPGSAIRFGSTGEDLPGAVARDVQGSLYLAGSFSGTVPFGGVTLTSAGAEDIVLTKTDPTFAVLWALRGGGAGTDRANALVLDRQNNPCVAGSFTDSASFGGMGVKAVRGVSLVDIVVAKAQASGAYLWARSAGGAEADAAYGVGIDNADELFVGGTFGGSAFFGDSALAGAGGEDLFVARLGAPATIATGEVLGSPFCSDASFPVPFTLFGVFGAGNVFTAQLSDSTGSFASPITIGELAGTDAGAINATLPPSVLTGRRYRVRIVSSNPPVGGSDNGVDLVIYGRLMPVIAPGPDVKLCRGGSVTLDAGEGFMAYQWSNGAVTRTISVSQAGKYAVIVFNEGGCVGTSDSVTLTEVPAPDKPVIVRTGQLLEVSPFNVQYVYQWLRNDEVIPGANEQRYLVTELGVYTVRVTNAQGCSVSADPELFVSSVPARERIAGVQLYPHPNNGVFNLAFPARPAATVTITIVDLLGHTVMSLRERAESGEYRRTIDMSAAAAGTYFLYLDNGNGEWFQEIVKR